MEFGRTIDWSLVQLSGEHVFRRLKTNFHSSSKRFSVVDVLRFSSRFQEYIYIFGNKTYLEVCRPSIVKRIKLDITSWYKQSSTICDVFLSNTYSFIKV